MNVGSARAAAVDWVMQHASKEPGFVGAYFSGSTVGKPDDAEISPSSDIDVVIVTEEAEPPLKLGKFIYQDVLIEATFLSWQDLKSPDNVLASYHLAGSFRVDTLMADPTGRLRKLQTEVSRQYADRLWVYRRCENVQARIITGLRSINAAAPWHDQVTAWLFPTGVTTHLLLVAALRNPTVRLRYLAARQVLQEYGHEDVYNQLLNLLGCEQMTSEQVMKHLEGLAQTFDAAADIAKTPFFFSSDITLDARAIAVDGSRELILNGNHREAIFWIVATYARCHKIFEADAPDLQEVYLHYFDAVLADLGIHSTQDLLERAERVLEFLPTLWSVTESIIAANPQVKGKAEQDV
ncbi:hypothetical protein JCM10914A_21920 [Paenibacillus sp. JCM 10914]|uniref:hypothetical protein n=1 Tax=Paenibacillus sp. JCM 10914 TaxID=1236974 RepID=UPI0003CC694C|nr:hypothetical protein [Paenibacillus sp. JCM 10914]GAE09345.1 hypothetical protein JCM10914_5703 [Paenibacillus sp. JCM 10914]